MNTNLIYKTGCLLFLALSFYIASYGQWVAQVSGTSSVTLNAVYAIDNNTAYVVGNQAFGIRTNNAGSSWMPMNVNVSSFSLDVNGIHFVSPTAGFTIGDAQEVLFTTNGGSSWASYSSGITDLFDLSIAPTAGGDLWVCGDIEVGYGFLYNQSTFSLSQPAAAQNKALRGICFITANTGYVVGDGGLILKTTNNGTTWIQQSSGVTQQLNKVKFTSANEGIAVGNNGTILRTTDGGTTWQLITNQGTENFNNVYYGSNNDVWIIGDGGRIIFSNNGGVSWLSHLSGTSANLYGISGSGSSSVWVCGASGTLLYYGNSTPPPGCESPSSISESNITAHTATLSWSAVAGSVGYQYALTSSLMPPVSTNNTVQNSITFDTLSGNRDYFFHIRTNCDSTYSEWIVHDFRTINTTGINSESAFRNMQLFPNPTKGASYLSGMPDKGTIFIYDCTGKIISKDYFNSDKKELDFSKLPKGLYLIKCSTDRNGTTFRKLILE